MFKGGVTTFVKTGIDLPKYHRVLLIPVNRTSVRVSTQTKLEFEVEVLDLKTESGQELGVVT